MVRPRDRFALHDDTSWKVPRLSESPKPLCAWRLLPVPLLRIPAKPSSFWNRLTAPKSVFGTWHPAQKRSLLRSG
jgi:hypothetical protein